MSHMRLNHDLAISLDSDCDASVSGLLMKARGAHVPTRRAVSVIASLEVGRDLVDACLAAIVVLAG